MSNIHEIQKRLSLLKKEKRTWRGVSDELSDRIGQSISPAAVWKTFHNRSRSVRVIRALGLIETRYRRTCEFKNEKQLRAFEQILTKYGLTLTTLARGIADGNLRIVEYQSVSSITDKEENNAGS